MTTYLYQIRDTHTQTSVGKLYTSRNRASRRVDRLDSAHGGYRYCVVRVAVETPVAPTGWQTADTSTEDGCDSDYCNDSLSIDPTAD